MFALEPAKLDKDSEIEEEPPKPPKAKVQPPTAMIQSLNAKVLPPKATALPRAINPIEDSDEDPMPPLLTPPPEMPLQKLRRSGRTAANVSISMMIEQRPKTYLAPLEVEEPEQLKEAIGKEVASIESHEVFTLVEKVPEGDSMLESHWVMGRELMANATIDKCKV